MNIPIQQQSIQSVSPEEFSSKFITMLSAIHQGLTPLIFPLGSIGITVCVLVLLLSSFTNSKELKKYGWGGIITVLIVTCFYYLYPLILGLFGGAAAKVI